MPTYFGDDRSSTANFAGSAGNIYGMRFALTENAIVNSIGVRGLWVSAARTERFCIYADGGSNKPTTILAVTAENSSTSGWTTYNEWHTIAIGPVALAAANYFLCTWIKAGSASYLGRTAANESGPPWYGGYVAKTYHATNSPGDLVTWNAYSASAFQILANYTPAATGCPVNLLRTRILSQGVM